MNPNELLTKLKEDELHQNWNKEHPDNFLSHLFCQIDSECKLKSGWETGFFDPVSGKITVFVELENKSFAIKPADDVFKKEDEKVEKLDLNGVKIALPTAIENCQTALKKDFPSEIPGDGFLTLQTINDKVVWNFSFITKSLKFVNVKIDAETGDEERHEEVNLVMK